MNIIDSALVYDPVARRADLAFDGSDFQLDDTPLTPVLMAIGNDRRANSDDELPGPVGNAYAPARLDPWRGWCLDFMDPFGRLIGSRMWLFVRRKQNEQTRRDVETWLTETLQPLAASRGWPMQLTVRWVRAGLLGWRVVVGQLGFNRNEAVG